MRQLTIFSKRKMVAKFASTKERKSSVFWRLRQQNSSQISQSEAFLSLGLFDKTNLQIVPKKFSAYYKCFVQ